MTEPKFQIPSIDRLLQRADTLALIHRHGREPVVAALRAATARYRSEALAGLAASSVEAVSESLTVAAAKHLRSLTKPSLIPVFNLTGTVLHTNLGRAPLPEAALKAIAAVATQATNLEYSLEAGKRGDRDDHVASWLQRLTGAEAATVVNNNAAAVMLVLNTLARRRGVIVSRGELVEIGGSFRIPDVMAAAGSLMREVGTTNRVHLRDYEGAIDARTGLIMKIHTSNYRIEGFTAAVAESELAALARKSQIPFVVDLGSGTLLDFERFGLPREPTVQEAIRDGADLVMFSGDKLLGGPQAGIIAGRADLIKKLKKNPMTRALRVDKLTLASLGAVLPLYADPARAVKVIPALRLLTRPIAEIEATAREVLAPLQTALRSNVEIDLVACKSQIGSGALPVEQLPSCGVRLRPLTARVSSRAVETLAARFRGLPMPVIGRIHQGALVFDLRCLEDPREFIAQLGVLPP
ncbi:MAG: L-seryl-tRNA(Sec) selenium transferase [Gammaproteobacteria bacterium]|nr:L-seryl-tRNA(Sec) selenium transferase [Gammaproteobacteria bacterium]